MDECGGIHRSYRFGVRNTEDEPVLEMGNALDMVVFNSWFKKRDSRLITYSSVACNTQIDYILSGTRTGI